jgi:glycosyltransferase involved in cell wall biosynthesis
MSTSTNHGLVSVIVASYNHAEYLEERMESLINQTYQNIEILVIDDCSRDRSVEVLRKYETHPKVNLIVREENGGWVAVSNLGVEISKGEFILFANCDDSCEPEMLEKLVESMHDNHTAGVAYCRSEMIDEDGNLLGDDFLGREDRFKSKCFHDVLITKKEMTFFLLHSCVIPNLSAALIRKDCYLDSGGMTNFYKVCADWDLFFRIAKKFDVAYLAKPLNKFRQHKTTIRSSTKNRDMYAEFFKLLLSQLNMGELDFSSRMRVRIRVMDLWIRYVAINPVQSLLNLNYHFILILKSDFLTLLFLPISFLAVCQSIFKKRLK